jgi:hypothetical protein
VLCLLCRSDSVLSELVRARLTEHKAAVVADGEPMSLVLDRDGSVWVRVMRWLRTGLIDPNISSFEYAQLSAEAAFFELPALSEALTSLSFSGHFTRADALALLSTKAFGGTPPLLPPTPALSLDDPPLTSTLCLCLCMC